MVGLVGYEKKKENQWDSKGILNNFVYLNTFPLGSYDVLIGMDWLDAHYVVSGIHNKTFTCLDEEGN